ncbi:response regulator transcription factor [Paenibacillus marinisediminis]
MRVLLIEDDAIVGEMIKMYLAEEGYFIRRADTGTLGLSLVREFKPDVVIIDYILPDLNGTEVCREIRKDSLVPIIMISMNTEVMNRVDALIDGADDYLCKPFSMKELSARMIANIRRAYHGPIQRESNNDDVGSRLERNSIIIEQEYRTINVNNRRVETTCTEFEIMKLFYNHPERVFSREELIIHLRGINTLVNERSIDVHVMKLRSKIEEDPKNPKYIKTVWGIGYKFTLN